jgi:hypothetical protein
MTTLALSRFELCATLTAALLAGCGGSQPPIGVPGMMQQSSAIATHAAHGRSWILPEAKGEDLLYVASESHGGSIFSYPQGKLVGAFEGFSRPMGLCSDAAGHVFLVDNAAQQILEYAHGGTSPIATFNDYGNDPNGCAVDPKTNNLAVVGGGGTVQGNIAVFKGEQGSPKVYYDKYNQGAYEWCTYDSSSDLFVNTGPGGPGFGLIEMPSGSSTFLEFNLDNKLRGGGAVQWYGKYLAVASPNGNGQGTKGPLYVYQIAVSGSTATVKKTITLSTGKRNRNPGYPVQFWIQGDKIVSSKTSQGNLGIWRYPEGAEPTRNIQDNGRRQGNAGLLIGVTVSVAPLH